MKQRAFSMILLLAMALAFGSALAVTKTASAQCGGPKEPACPPAPEKKKKPTPTDLPTKTPLPTPTAQPPVAVQSIVVATPNASQLAALCANLPAVQGGNTGSNVGNATGPGGGAGATSSPPKTSGFMPTANLELGGGVLLLGVLIGLLLPGISRGFNGGIFFPGQWGRSRVNGDGNFNGDGFSQSSVKVFPKVENGGFDKQGEAGALFIKHGGGVFDKRGEAGMQDIHQKASGENLGQDAKTGYLKQDNAHMGDASVHNMDNQFQKGSDAGITDGSSFTGNG